MAKSNANSPVVLTAYIGTVSTAGSCPLFNIPKNFILTSVLLLDQNGIVADNTNYVTLTAKKGATAIAALDTRAANQGAATALVGKAFALDAAVVTGLVANGVANEIPAGDYSLLYAEGGSGTTTLAQVQFYGYFK